VFFVKLLRGSILPPSVISHLKIMKMNLIEELRDEPNQNLIQECENVYSIRVYGRGLHLFFRENEKCLMCNIDAEHGAIYKKSICKWDLPDNLKMNKAEQERVTALIVKFYQQFYNSNVILMDAHY
jgi:uncharacterized protein YqkB